MAFDSIEVTDVIPAPRELVYAAWLSSAEHSAMTGSLAEIDPNVNGDFTAWDGYIRGTHLDLDPDRLIVERWRTTDFPDDSPPSRLEIWFDPDESGGTRLTLRHSDLPEGQGDMYRSGWAESYFIPMKAYFSRAPQAPFPPPDEVAPEELPLPIDEGEIETQARRAAAAAKSVTTRRPAKKKKRAAPKKTSARKPAARKTPAKKAAAKKSAAKKRPAAKKRATVKKTSARKSATRKAPAKRPAAKKKKSAAKKRR